FAYLYLLNRSPDSEGLRTYAQIYQADGPDAVARGLASSREFRDRQAAAGNGANNGQTSEPNNVMPQTEALAQQVVRAYDSGVALQVAPDDALGRVGFVL